MLADPQTVTIDGSAKTLAAVSRSDGSSIYRTSDGVYTLTVSRRTARNRTRFVCRIDHKGLDADPLTSGSFIPVSASWYFVMDKPETGYDQTDFKNVALGLTGFLTSATLLKVLGGET